MLAARIPSATAMTTPPAPSERSTCRRLSLAALLLGVLLLGYMVVVEGEPGALPLALVLGGGVARWLCRRRR